jgi:hypothetical protein
VNTREDSGMTRLRTTYYAQFALFFKRLSFKECQRWVAFGGLILIVIALLVLFHPSLPHDGSTLPTSGQSTARITLAIPQRKPPTRQESKACATRPSTCVPGAPDIPVVKAAGTPLSGPTATAPPSSDRSTGGTGLNIAQNILLDYPILLPVWLYQLPAHKPTNCSVLTISLWQGTSALRSPGDWDIRAWLPFLPGLDVGYHPYLPEVPRQTRMRGVPLWRAPPLD